MRSISSTRFFGAAIITAAALVAAAPLGSSASINSSNIANTSSGSGAFIATRTSLHQPFIKRKTNGTSLYANETSPFEMKSEEAQAPPPSPTSSSMPDGMVNVKSDHFWHHKESQPTAQPTVIVVNGGNSGQPAAVQPVATQNQPNVIVVPQAAPQQGAPQQVAPQQAAPNVQGGGGGQGSGSGAVNTPVGSGIGTLQGGGQGGGQGSTTTPNGGGQESGTTPNGGGNGGGQGSYPAPTGSQGGGQGSGTQANTNGQGSGTTGSDGFTKAKSQPKGAIAFRA